MSLGRPGGPAGGARGRLLTLYERLSEGDRDTLLAFAEFLCARQPAAPARPGPPGAPDPAPRPAGESVVAAIRRLSAGYPMLDRRRLLNATSGLMAQHVLHGRAATEVIDELERAFADQYQELVRAWQEQAGAGDDDTESS